MLFNMPYAKDVIIKNMTGEELKDFYLIYEGLEKSPYKISTIASNKQKTINLVLMYLTKPTNLRLLYNRNGEKKEVVVYENLRKDDLRTIILTINMDEDDFKVDTVIQEGTV
ncbi:hypothetical protein [Clostridium sp. C2-6-12]|uniref:hypothetical protein n=1 Tax=Clostridium sp. C2-6-12 TaxID=2698832 RepID=UPI00136D0415|nr:hypothetical protein [Clostridium sp. C2-6-12]